MERRKLLIGSGAAFVTALAGCVGSEDDDGGDDDTESEETDDSGEHSDEHEDDEHEDEDEHDEDAYDDVPGFEAEELSIDSESVHVDRVTRDEAVVSVHATTETTDPDALYAELETLSHDLSAPTVDIDELKTEIDVIEWTFVDDAGDTLLSADVRPIWIYDYLNDDLTEEAFLDLVLETADWEQDEYL